MNNPSLKEIVFRANNKPIIVNEQSKFVVVTYWWGRGNFNANVARPCMAYYEEFTTELIALAKDYFTDVYSKEFRKKVDMSDIDKVLEFYASHLKTLPPFERFLKRISNQYLRELYIDVGFLDHKDPNVFNKAKDKIATMRNNGESPSSFTLLDNVNSEQTCIDQIYNILSDIAIEILRSYRIRKEIYELYQIKERMIDMQKMYLTKPNPGDDNSDKLKDTLRPEILQMKEKRKVTMNNIKDYLKEKSTITVSNQSYQNKNIYDILNELLRYRSATTFQDMIDRWNRTCQLANCNYLSVEYDYFSATKQYQLAINAKPLFIKRALELCDGRAIVYIDGDMFVRKYPHIFDMDNIDFMARGWNIDDHRSRSINYKRAHFNPYRFETSGGIMYFSNSHESIQLIDLWIEQSATPANQGKADDRILSMIFNMKKYALNMNIIQLPIEYLWLTLSYNDPMLDDVYDWDKKAMDDSIFIEHPECLTSEETAGGSDIFSNRTPKFHRYLDTGEDDIPTSEEYYEYFAFNNPEMATQFSTYHKSLDTATYQDTDNPLLIDLGFVDPQDSSKNARLLNITPFNQWFGKKRSPIVRRNIPKIDKELDTTFWKTNKGKQILSKRENDNTTIILCENNLLGDSGTPGHLSKYLIPMVISIIKMGYSVIYLPDKCRETCYLELLNSRRKNLELVFFPVINEMTDMLKPVIDVSQPVYFHRTSQYSRLLLALIMFENLGDMSSTFSKGFYQIISRIRIGYVFKSAGSPDTVSALSSYCTLSDNREMVLPPPPLPIVAQTGGAPKRTISESEVQEYLDGQRLMYGSGVKRYKRPKKITRKRKYKKQKRRKTKKRRRSRKWK